MSQANSITKKIAKVFIDYCKNKKYQVKQSKEVNDLRIDIFNLSEKTVVKIYNKGTIQIQGKQNSLKTEMEKLKMQIEIDLYFSSEYETQQIKVCTTKYDIMLPELRTKIKKSLNMLGTIVEITENPSSTIEYRAKITRNNFSINLNQYSNGTLLLQGKIDELFNDSCNLIEKITKLSDKEVTTEFTI